MANGWLDLGAVLGGGIDEEGAYLEGQLTGNRAALAGNQAQEALAKARIRRDEAEQRLALRDTLRAAGHKDADTLASVMLSGMGNFQQATAGAGNIQEQEFRARAADPSVPLGEGNRALMGVSSGPVEPFQVEGGLAADIFAPEKGLSVTPVGQADINFDEARAGKASTEASMVVPLAEALIGQRDASAAYSDARRENPELYRAPGTTINLGEMLGGTADGGRTPSIPTDVDFSEGVGLGGAFREGANIVMDVFGADLPFPEASEAAEALKNLSLKTQMTGNVLSQSRLTNYIAQRLTQLAVEPGDVLRGNQRALSRFRQTRDFLDNEFETLATLISNPGVSKADRSELILARSHMAGLVANYNAVLDAYERRNAEAPAAAGALPSGWSVTQVP